MCVCLQLAVTCEPPCYIHIYHILCCTPGVLIVPDFANFALLSSVVQFSLQALQVFSLPSQYSKVSTWCFFLIFSLL